MNGRWGGHLEVPIWHLKLQHVCFLANSVRIIYGPRRRNTEQDVESIFLERVFLVMQLMKSNPVGQG